MSYDLIKVGQENLQGLCAFQMHMDDDEMRELAETAIQTRRFYVNLAEFKRQLDARRTRWVGFKAALSAIDVPAFTEALGTTPERFSGVVGYWLNMEEQRLDELDYLFSIGELPDTPVLDDADNPLMVRDVLPLPPEEEPTPN